MSLGDTVALTYADLAERLGIEVASAKARAVRSRWHRARGNDGRTLVHVPVEALAAAPAAKGPKPDAAHIHAAHEAEMHRVQANHEAELHRFHAAHEAELRRQSEAMKATIEAHRAEAERLAKLVDRLTEPWSARLLRLVRSDRQ